MGALEILGLVNVLTVMCIIITDYMDKICNGLVDEVLSKYPQSSIFIHRNKFDVDVISMFLICIPIFNLYLCIRYKNVNVNEK